MRIRDDWFSKLTIIFFNLYRYMYVLMDFLHLMVTCLWQI